MERERCLRKRSTITTSTKQSADDDDQRAEQDGEQDVRERSLLRVSQLLVRHRLLLRYLTTCRSWRVDRKPSETPRDLNMDCLSLVYYAFVSLEKNGSVFVSSISIGVLNLDLLTDRKLSNEDKHMKQEVDGASGCLGSFIALKRDNPHLKVLLSIGGGGNSSQNFSSVAAAASTRDTFARSAVSLVKEGGFDGIDSVFSSPLPHKSTELI